MVGPSFSILDKV